MFEETVFQYCWIVAAVLSFSFVCCILIYTITVQSWASCAPVWAVVIKWLLLHPTDTGQVPEVRMQGRRWGPPCRALWLNTEVRIRWGCCQSHPHPYPGIPSHPTRKAHNASNWWTYCLPACVAVSGWWRASAGSKTFLRPYRWQWRHFMAPSWHQCLRYTRTACVLWNSGLGS